MFFEKSYKLLEMRVLWQAGLKGFLRGFGHKK